MYKIKLTAKARKELKILSKKNQLVIRYIIDDLKNDPYLGKPLIRELKNRFSYRVSNYRIIYKINKKDKIIQIITAGHRATVYK